MPKLNEYRAVARLGAPRPSRSPGAIRVRHGTTQPCASFYSNGKSTLTINTDPATDPQRQSFLTVVVGQNALLRDGLVSILRAAGFRVLDPACSVSDLDMSLLSQQQQPILMIVATGDDSTAAVEQIELFKDPHINGSVVVVANRFRLNDVILAFQQGTKAYFMKEASSAAFIKYLELVMMGETIVPQEILSFILDRKDDYQNENEIRVNSRHAKMNTDDNHVCENTHVPRFSDREKDILRYLISGSSNKAIARKIDIPEATVKVYINAILRKVKVQNRTQAAIWVMNNGSLIFAVDKSSSNYHKRSAETLFTLEVVPALKAA
jgi:DNA-binding NarL/FixJ family response regulator